MYVATSIVKSSAPRDLGRPLTAAEKRFLELPGNPGNPFRESDNAVGNSGPGLLPTPDRVSCFVMLSCWE